VNGPYGLSEICYFGHYSQKLPVDGKLSVRSDISATHHDRLVIVKTALSGHKYADAWFDGDRAEIALAEQWLLDMCVVMYGGAE